MGITSTLIKMREKIHNVRISLLNALSDKGIHILEDDDLLEEWGTIAILNSYYIRELNNLTIYEIMHIQRKKNLLIDNSYTITIHNCVNLARRLKENNNLNIMDIPALLHSRIYWDNVTDISWSIVEKNGGGVAYDIHNNIIVTIDDGNNWILLDDTEFPSNIKRIIPIAFTKNTFFVIFCTDEQILVLLYEYCMGHWFISNTDNNENLKVFHPSVLYTGYHIQAFIQKTGTDFTLIINAYGLTDMDRTSFKTHTFALPIKYNSAEIKSIGLWKIYSPEYLSEVPYESKIFFSKYMFNSSTGKIEPETNITRYIVYGTTMYLSIQTNISSELIITRKYDISAFEYGEISKDIGHTRNIRWIQTSMGYFFISSAMEIFFVKNMKLFVPLDNNRGIALMSDKNIYLYSINELTEINIRDMKFTFGFRGSFPREVILHNEIFGNIRIIFTDTAQISFISYQNPSIISPSYHTKPTISQNTPYASDSAGTIIAYDSPSVKYNVNFDIREELRNIILSNDNGISWSVMQPLIEIENVYGIWHLDNKWVMLDHNGRIHWGDKPENIVSNLGASLENLSETLFKNRMNEYSVPGYNLLFEIELDKMDILIIPVYRSIGESNKIDNPPFIYRCKIKDIFSQTEIIPVINMYSAKINFKNLASLNNLYANTYITSTNSVLVSSNKSEIVLNLLKGNINHSNACAHIDYRTGKKSYYSGRLYNINSKKELLCNDKKLCGIINMNRRPILILKSNGKDIYSVGYINGDIIEETNHIISNINIDNLRYLGCDNFVVKGTHMYYVYDNSLYEQAFETIDPENSTILSKCVVGGIGNNIRIKYVGCQIILLSNDKNIGILNCDTVHFMRDINVIQDICEWENKIWFICNIEIENETRIFLASNKYLHNIFNIDTPFIDSELVNNTSDSNDYYEICTEITENLIMTPCEDFIVIWNMNSNIIIIFQNYTFTEIVMSSNIVRVSYSNGIIYTMTENNEIYYSYDGYNYTLYPQTDIDYIWNINGTLCISANDTLIINSGVIGKNQGYICDFNNTENSTHIHPYAVNNLEYFKNSGIVFYEHM